MIFFKFRIQPLWSGGIFVMMVKLSTCPGNEWFDEVFPVPWRKPSRCPAEVRNETNLRKEIRRSEACPNILFPAKIDQHIVFANVFNYPPGIVAINPEKVLWCSQQPSCSGEFTSRAWQVQELQIRTPPGALGGLCSVAITRWRIKNYIPSAIQTWCAGKTYLHLCI